MNTLDLIKMKQKIWAKNAAIAGKQNGKGR